ncbi:PfkB domain protein [Chthoniobacter flavus Ellin428]|uniref:PfkB domain protein n=1 Tax=Chthoniobacter flavus Ellin428 TaxID=497964 RepID=B4DBL6_9BACT|nr:carbohydrate kinase [Chthoniobacter flavus]EDY16203.1 PfkB domain protein [Chthoniobacter flavus Ellin428]TCO87204.1 fructokinase [Chthoniobacter flavus]
MISPEFKIVGIGEVLWDLLPAGQQLGGAPANFVCHAHALGADARLISRIGNDPDGREIIERFRARGLPTDTLAIDSTAPTGTVSVTVDAAGHPQYIIHENVAWDRIAADEIALEAVRNADAVCFGSLAQRTPHVVKTVATLLAATRPDTLRIFDINLRPPFIQADVITSSLTAANALKLNDQELPVLAELFQLTGSPAEQLTALAKRFSLRLIALTRGGDGSMLWADGQLVEQPRTPITVRDTVGAGDSFTAAVTVGFLHRWSLDQISQHANAVAAYVCSQAGATPPLPDPLLEPFQAALRKDAVTC